MKNKRRPPLRGKNRKVKVTTITNGMTDRDTFAVAIRTALEYLKESDKSDN